jgi:uroporphyrinogen decarboxylase
MEIKKYITDSLNYKPQPRIPIFYRGDLIINDELIRHFGLSRIEKDYPTLIEKLGADFYTGGVTLSDFHTFAPKYIGPGYDAYHDPNFFFTFGIHSKVVEHNGRREFISYFDEPQLSGKNDISDIKSYNFPAPDWFDFNLYKNILTEVEIYIPYYSIKRLDDYFLGTLLYSSVFMISSYLRGMETLLEDLAINKKYAGYLIDTVGEICLEVSKRNLEKIGKIIEIYGMWDDFAMQSGMMMNPEIWRKYYKPWYKKIIQEAKKYDLRVMFHCCGSCREIIPDFIEIGVDILDPVQTSARDMDLLSLKTDFGKDICFHGGLDIQQLLVQGNVESIVSEVRRINNLFKDDGGLLFGPSHYITSDTPLENVFAIYKALRP